MGLKNNSSLLRILQRFQETPPPFMIPWKMWRNLILGCACFTVLLIVLTGNIQICVNQSQSLPHKLFICGRGFITHRGDIVSIENHPTQYFGNIHYTKQLMGLPGDKIVHHKGFLSIETSIENQEPMSQNIRGNGFNKIDDNETKFVNSEKSIYPIGPLLKETKDGKPLHPLKATIIPEGYVFVATSHPRSFDSRYEEFGLVKQEHITGKCFGLFPSKAQSRETSR